MQVIRKNSTTELSLEELEETFKGELAEADKWYEEIITDEKKWIAEGGNVDEAFSQKYYQDVDLAASPELPPARSINDRIKIAVGILAVGFALFVTVTLMFIAWLIRRSRNRSDSTVA